MVAGLVGSVGHREILYVYAAGKFAAACKLIGTTTITSNADVAWPLNTPQTPTLVLPGIPSAHLDPVSVEAPTSGRAGSTNGVIINNLASGTYFFSVQTESNAGLLSDRPSEVEVQLGVSALADTLSSVTNYPNPFDSRKTVTTINYMLNQNSQVEITIYDIYGGKVKSMTYGAGENGGMMGTNNVTWDGTDGSGTKVSKGIYLCLLSKPMLSGGIIRRRLRLG